MFVSVLVTLCSIGTFCNSLPPPRQFLPVAIQLDQVDFVPPSDPNNTKTHEENLVLRMKPEVSNLLIPPSDEEKQDDKLTDLLLPEELSKIENTSLPVKNFIAQIISGFIRKNETSKTNSISTTTPASQHIMKIENNVSKENTENDRSSSITTTEEIPVEITVKKVPKSRRRKIKTRPEGLLIHENANWHLKTINEKPADEVLATDKASLARDLKDETTESAVIKVRRIG